MRNLTFDAGVTDLANHGLNLVAVFDSKQLPQDICGLLGEADIDLDSYHRLVMLGNGGRDFWQAFAQEPPQRNNPVDQFSIAVATRFIEACLMPCDWQLLYPGSMLLPLQRLGELAGWCHPSPLGSGISPAFGLWFAYRVAFVTTADLPVHLMEVGDSPCLSCKTRDCVAACPSLAVRWDDSLKLDDCIEHRLQVTSSCATQCLARLACPYEAEHRYTTEQIHYHYSQSLASLRRYRAEQRGQHVG